MSCLVLLLVDQGLPVRAVHRGALPDRPGVENVVADVSTPEGARRAIEGAEVAYAVVQPAYTRWVQEFPGLMSVIADAAARAGARVVFLDNLYGYGPVSGPIHEGLPQSATTRKGAVRAAVAADLLARHQRGNLAVTIGRASDYIGPRGTSLPNALVLDPVAKRRKGRSVGGSTERTASATPLTSPHIWSSSGLTRRRSGAPGTCPSSAPRPAASSSGWHTGSAASTRHRACSPR